MPAGSFFEPLGDDRFRSTEHTRGPWDPGFQHAGPPSALLTRLMETQRQAWPGPITRVSVDIIGPVPVADLTARTTVLRTGRSIELLSAELEHDGRVAIRATAWRIRRTELDLPPLPPEHDDPAGDEVPPFPDTDVPAADMWSEGYLTAMQWRVARGDWGHPGPATIWGRMGVPLLPDEEPSGLQRVMALADSGNGISYVLPLDSWLFINPDLTVHLAAEPQGEWMCLDARTRVDAAGFGLATSRLFDRERLVARGNQSLYIGPR
jgi:hypothetical protein